MQCADTPIGWVWFKEDQNTMLTPISSNAAAAPQAVAPQAAVQSAHAAAVSPNRANAPDTVTISPAGQKALHSVGDVDHDGDSH
jgi:hypothetical protein